MQRKQSNAHRASNTSIRPGSYSWWSKHNEISINYVRRFIVATVKKSKVHIAPVVFEQVIAKIEAQPVGEQPTPKSKGLGIGALVKELISQGLKNDEVLVKVKEQFPTASTNKACISWYRSDLKKKST